MCAKGNEKWHKRPPHDCQKWAELLAHMVEDYERQIAKTGVTTIRQEGYGTTMHAMDDLTNENSPTEAVTKYAERVTQA